jgi:hypothetical protein
MIRHVVIFLICAGIGAVLVLVVRSALHRPYGEPQAPTVPHEHEPSPAAPHEHEAPPEHQHPAPVTPDPHAGHAGHISTTTTTPVNTTCAICGMDVDPTLPTAMYQGKAIGFACVKCPPLFAKDPERYGPHYLKNEKAP